MSAKQAPTKRAQHWQQHMDAWQLSGISKARYCRDNDLSYCVFNYWHAKLISPKNKTALVPVALSSVSDTSNTGTLQLELPNGMQITGIETESVSLVGRLIAQL